MDTTDLSVALLRVGAYLCNFLILVVNRVTMERLA